MEVKRKWTGHPAGGQPSSNALQYGAAAPGPKSGNGLVRADGSYREALGAAAWSRLSAEVRARFAVGPAAAQAICFAGTMHRVELSAAGWLFAQACRLIGTPLAPRNGRHVPMRIELQADEELGGVSWQRIYEFSPRQRYIVRSTKCKGGPGEFVEHIGRGFSMRLDLAEENGNLVFRSTAYQCRLFGRTVRIPDWLTPGRTTVRHEQLCGNRFRFSLSVDHPLLGRTIYQDGEFYSVASER